jgi:hypothetical protein
VQLGFAKIGECELGFLKIRAGQICALQIRVCEIQLIQIGVRQIRACELGSRASFVAADEFLVSFQNLRKLLPIVTNTIRGSQTPSFKRIEFARLRFPNSSLYRSSLLEPGANRTGYWASSAATATSAPCVLPSSDLW